MTFMHQGRQYIVFASGHRRTDAGQRRAKSEPAAAGRPGAAGSEIGHTERTEGDGGHGARGHGVHQ